MPLWFPAANAVLDLSTSSDRLISGSLGALGRAVAALASFFPPPGEACLAVENHLENQHMGEFILLFFINCWKVQVGY